MKLWLHADPLREGFRSRTCLCLAVILCLALDTRAQSAPVQTLPGHVPAAASRLTPIGRPDPNRRMRLALGLPLRHQADLTQLLQQLYDPASPAYHRYLSAREFANQFGPTPEDYAALSAFAATNGLTVVATYSNRVVLDVEGTTAAIEHTFHTTLRVYRHPFEARNFFAPDREPSIDTSVPVLHVAGLDDFVVPHPLCAVEPATARVAGNRAFGSGSGGSYLGYDFRAAYVPGVALTGTGQTVGLLEFDSGFSQSDITAYENLAGLPNVPVSAVLLDGYNGGLGDGNGEVSLDIEMAIAMAPGLSGVLVYEGTYTDDVLNRMASDNQAKQISASWTYGIDATSQQDFQEFAAQGQSFFNASGDGDAWVGTIQTPCDDTNITIVGGTTLNTSGPGGVWRSEQVWNLGYDPPGWPGTDNGYWGSGGGISTVYAIPPWQQGIDMTTNQGSTTMRNIPDVALTADNIFVTYSNGLSDVFFGTSCAAPLWAGLVALVNQQAAANGRHTIGFINPAIYAVGNGANYTNCFHDIVVGNNTTGQSPALFFAVPGYDLCTGWGTPAGEPLIDALAPDALGISPAGGLFASGPVGGPFTNASLTILLTNQSTANLKWACLNSSPWLSVQPANGTLLPGQLPTAVTVALNGAATNLSEGAYSAVIWFTNLTDGIGQRRANTLVVNPRQLGTYAATLLGLQPAGYWPLNETIVPPPADVVSNVGSLGLAANAFPFANPVQGSVGIVSNCVYFANSNLLVAYLGTHVDVPFVSALNPGGPFTVEFWAKPNQYPNDFFCAVSSIDDTQNGGNSRLGWVFYEASGNEWNFRVGNANGYVAVLTGGTVRTQVWQHVTGVYDGANVTLYVNGVAVAGPTSASGFAPNSNPLAPLRMGATSFGNRTFDGALDELAVYTNALTAGTIYAHYQAATTNNSHYGAQILTSHPAGYWHLDEPAYTPVSLTALPAALNLGSLSYAADGTYYPGTTPGVAGAPGVGLGSSNLACAFDATSFIDVPGSLVSFTGAVTLSAWVNCPGTLGQTESVASLGAGSYDLTVDGQGYAHFVDGAQPFGTLTSPNPIDDGHWHNLVGIYDGTNSQYLYVDGELAASAANATLPPDITGNDLWIGGDPDANAFQFFYGAIDEVAVWSEALSMDQILWLYSSAFNITRLNATVNSPGRLITLSWPALSGQTYDVQYTTNLLNPSWTLLGGPITATNSTATASDSITNSRRFYRVVLLP